MLSDKPLLVILSLSFIGGLGTGVPSPAMPEMVSALGISEGQIGYILSVFFLGTVLALPLSGLLMDNYGRRPVVLSLVFLFGAAGTAIAFVRSFELILLLRFLQGIGFAGTIPLSVTLVGDLYSGPTGSSAQGLNIGASGVARIVVPAVAGFLVSIAWFVPFLLHGVALLVFVIAYFYLPETMNSRESGPGESTTESYPSRVRAAVRGLINELRHPPLAVLLGGVFLIFSARFTITTFVPLYAVTTMNASYFVAGVALSVTGIPRLIVSPFAGSFDDKVDQRTAFVATIGMLGVGILLIGVVENVVALFAVLTVYGVGDALYNPILNNTVTGMAEAGHRGRITSIMETLKTGAIVTSPALFGVVLAAIGYEQMFALAGILALLPSIPILFFIGE
ncbi:MFS transporter [Salinarchaeum chitinilyticum]